MSRCKPVLMAISQPIVRGALTTLLLQAGIAVSSLPLRQADINAALHQCAPLCLLLSTCDGRGAVDLACRITMSGHRPQLAVVLVTNEACIVSRRRPRERLVDPSLAELLTWLKTPR